MSPEIFLSRYLTRGWGEGGIHFFPFLLSPLKIANKPNYCCDWSWEEILFWSEPTLLLDSSQQLQISKILFKPWFWIFRNTALKNCCLSYLFHSSRHLWHFSTLWTSTCAWEWEAEKASLKETVSIKDMESGSERCKTACIRLWRALEGCVAGKRQRSPQARLGSMSKHARAESGSRVAPSSTSYRKFGIWAAALLAVSRFLPRLRSQNCSFFSGHQLVRADMLGGRQVICA